MSESEVVFLDCILGLEDWEKSIYLLINKLTMAQNSIPKKNHNE